MEFNWIKPSEEPKPMTLDDKVQRAQEALQLAAKMSKRFYEKKLVVCYSGGKDSDVLVHLAESCLDKDDFRVMNSHTSVDAPETVYHIRETIKRLNEKGIEAEVRIPRYKDGTPITMWNLIERHSMPPTRLVRYCCKYLKEASTPHSISALGVRADESKAREGRDLFAIRGATKKDTIYFSLDHSKEVYEESLDRDPVWDCTLIETMRKNGDTLVNPIYEWTDKNIWDYIRRENIEMNPLYECGFGRVGCIGCPLANANIQKKEFARWPAYESNYIKAFDRMVKRRRERGLKTVWQTGEDVMTWWLGGDPNQMTIDQWLKEMDEE